MIGWSIFPDFFDILLADDPKALRIIMDNMYRHGHAGIFNKLYRKMMEKSELVKWNLMHGMYAYGAKDPVGYVKKVRKFTLKGVGDKVTGAACCIRPLSAEKDILCCPEKVQEGRSDL